MMGGEDFSRYGRAGVPIFLYWLGTIEPKRVAEAKATDGKPLPSLHSDLVRAGAGADHQDRRADDEHGGAEPAGQVKRASIRGSVASNNDFGERGCVGARETHSGR